MTKWLKAVIFLFLFFCSACDRRPANELVYLPQKNPDNLTPILKINEEAKYLCELIFDGLVNKTTLKEGKEQYEWALAEEYREESADDRRLITIYLKKGILWHDGREFTSADVIYTWKAINQSNSPLKAWLNTFIEDINTVDGDNYKVKIRLKIERSMEAFMELVSTVKILPCRYSYKRGEKELPFNLTENSDVSEAFKWKPVGTGPYKITDRRSEIILLCANENYPLSAPAIKNIRMQVVTDITKAVRVLKGNQFALLFDVKPDFFDELKQESLKSQTYIPFSFYAIAYNTRRAPFNEYKFRKIVNSATDKKELAQKFIGTSEANSDQYVNTSIFPATSSYVLANSDNFLESDPFNANRARDGINSFSSSDKVFHLIISSQIEGNKAREFANSYVEMMRRIGIKVVVDDYNAPLYYRKVKDHDFDAVFMSFTGFDHLYDFRELFGNNEEYNVWGVDDRTLKELLEEFGATLSWEKLKMWTVAIHNRIEEIAPACFLFSVPRKAYYSNRLRDVSIHPEVGFSTIEKWQLQETKE